MTHPRDPLRARAALASGRAAGRLSQVLGRGSGSMIGGRLALRVDPEVLRAVAGDRRTVVVTGTNGKSTVTALVAAALSPGGAVVSNSTGANMTDGIVTAMAADRTSGLAAIECDEVYLGPVARGTRPKAVVVLNSSREYTRGVSLKSTLEHWRRTAATLPADCVASFNIDAPLVCRAFETAPRRIGDSGGLYWRDDALVCPACGTVQEFTDASWSCSGCGRSRPEPDWTVVPDGEGWAVEHHGARTRIDVTVPGRTGPVGGAFALAAADALAIDVATAADRISAVADVDGRYAPYQVGQHQARLLMLKNPAGWAEAIDVAVSTGRPLVVALDPFGPKDTATMWEAPFQRLAGQVVQVTGGRRADGLAILEAAGVEAREAPDFETAVTSHAPGEVIVACNYPAFRRISKQFRGGTP